MSLTAGRYYISYNITYIHQSSVVIEGGKERERERERERDFGERMYNNSFPIIYVT